MKFPIYRYTYPVPVLASKPDVLYQSKCIDINAIPDKIISMKIGFGFFLKLLFISYSFESKLAMF